MVNWGNIPIELAIEIVEHADLYEDFEAFRFVSSLWRSAAKQAKFRSTINVPWLMLPEHDNSTTTRRFYSLSSGRVRHIDLLSASPNFFKDDTKLLSSHGWLLSISDEGNNISLLNPLSGFVKQLPTPMFYRSHSRLYPYFYPTRLFEKFILSANPSTTSSYTIALNLVEPYANLCCWDNVIVFWSSDDDQWVPLSETKSASRDLPSHILSNCKDICFFQGHFYAVDCFGYVLRFDLNQETGIPRVVLVSERVTDRYYKFYYLVESDGKLLRVNVNRVEWGKNYYSTTSFEIFELNLDDGTATKIHDLGSRSIFVGSNSSFSIEAASENGCKPNRVYYTDQICYHGFGSNHKSDGKDIGVYNLANGEIECFYEGTPSYNQLTPLMWVESPAASSPYDYDSGSSSPI